MFLPTGVGLVPLVFLTRGTSEKTWGLLYTLQVGSYSQRLTGPPPSLLSLC